MNDWVDISLRCVGCETREDSLSYHKFCQGLYCPDCQEAHVKKCLPIREKAEREANNYKAKMQQQADNAALDELMYNTIVERPGGRND